VTRNDETSGKDSIRAAAAAALDDLNALSPDSEDRQTLLNALLSAHLNHLAPVAGGDQAGGGRIDDGKVTPAISEGDLLGRIASGLKVERDTVELVYDITDGEPHVVVSPKRIATNKSLATKQLGQLVAAARQILNLEEWTPVSTIRQVVTDFGRLDSSNFAASIQQMDSVALVRGKGTSREVKITKPGLEATADLINSIVKD
jgi:hypothetical protein